MFLVLAKVISVTIWVNISNRSPRYVKTLTCKFISKIKAFNAMAIGEFLVCKLFLRISISNKIFHFDYKHITDRLPDSLIKRAYQGLLNHFINPVLLEIISGKSDRIKSYLRHKLEVYENLLNRKCESIAQEKLLCPWSWPECNVFPASPAIYVADNRIQTNNTTCYYNKRTFEKFMQDIEREYRKQISANKKLWCEIEDATAGTEKNWHP